MTAVASCPGRLFVTIRRKKSALLGAILITAIVLVCLQYNVAKDTTEDEAAKVVPISYQLNQAQQLAAMQRSAQNYRPLDKVEDSDDDKPVQFIANSNSIVTDFPIIDRNSENFPQYPVKSAYPNARKQMYVPLKRLVHFDLKGAPPRVSYIVHVIHIIRRLGATGIILEWEDMFPWTGPIKDLAATNAYTHAEIDEILKLCRDFNLEVIPLIQTFGHMEFALKYDTFEHLREVPESPQALCPSLNESLTIVDHMVQQVLDKHKDIQFLHIGCDEVFQLGECPRCRPKLREDLFLSHVAAVAGVVKKKNPHITPIIWDDMLRHLPATTIQMYRLGELVEPMVWVYAEDIYRFVPSNVWDKLASVFPYVWTASAFKGAFGERLYVPNVKRHLENNLNWLELMNNETPLFKGGFRGIALTGWQRYDHFATLCELLPAAIPSLVVNLLATSHGYFNSSLKSKLTYSLDCNIMPPQTISLMTDPFLWDALGRCQFPGHMYFSLTSRFNSLQHEVNEFLENIEKKRSWMTLYNVQHNFSSPLRVDELLSELTRLQHAVYTLMRSAVESLENVYDDYTVSEWLEQNFYPMIKKLEDLQNDGTNLKSRKVWQRRPFPILNQFEKYGLNKDSTRTNNKHLPKSPGG